MAEAAEEPHEVGSGPIGRRKQGQCHRRAHVSASPALGLEESDPLTVEGRPTYRRGGRYRIALAPCRAASADDGLADEAERLIVLGFFDDVFARLPVTTLIEPLRRRVIEKIEHPGG